MTAAEEQIFYSVVTDIGIEKINECLINWVGGKRLLRKTIAPLIPEDIKSYIEPFAEVLGFCFTKTNGQI